jgi:hypothetical protein
LLLRYRDDGDEYRQAALVLPVAQGLLRSRRRRGAGARIKDEDLDGRAEAEELREALERVQAITLEISEGLDAYQERHAR